MALVTVGCKLPAGLILEVGEKRVTVNGSNSSVVIGGHGITEGVDKDFFDSWLSAHSFLDFVKNGFLFAHEKANNVTAEAKDKASVETGFEPINPSDKPAGLTAVA